MTRTFTEDEHAQALEIVARAIGEQDWRTVQDVAERLQLIERYLHDTKR